MAVAMSGGGLCPEPALAQPADVRVLTLRVVAEEMYRARPGWEAELQRTVKTVSDIYSPVGGEVTEVNTALEASSELLNQDPYGKGWLIKVRQDNVVPEILDPDAYKALLIEH